MTIETNYFTLRQQNKIFKYQDNRKKIYNKKTDLEKSMKGRLLRIVRRANVTITAKEEIISPPNNTFYSSHMIAMSPLTTPFHFLIP